MSRFQTEGFKLLSAIVANRSTRSMRAFFVCGKGRITKTKHKAHFDNGHFTLHGKLVSTSAALRRNARVARVYLCEEYLMRRRPFAFGTLY